MQFLQPKADSAICTQSSIVFQDCGDMKVQFHSVIEVNRFGGPPVAASNLTSFSKTYNKESVSFGGPPVAASNLTISAYAGHVLVGLRPPLGPPDNPC